MPTASQVTLLVPPAEAAKNEAALELQYDSGGDGTVTHESLEVCDFWRKQAELEPDYRAPVKVKIYQGIEHATILADPTAFNDAVGFVLEASGIVGASSGSGGGGSVLGSRGAEEK